MNFAELQKQLGRIDDHSYYQHIAINSLLESGKLSRDKATYADMIVYFEAKAKKVRAYDKYIGIDLSRSHECGTKPTETFMEAKWTMEGIEHSRIGYRANNKRLDRLAKDLGIFVISAEGDKVQ